MVSITKEKIRWQKLTPTRLTTLFLSLLVLLYGGWLTYVITADRPLDFYVYYMAAEAALRDQNPYSISPEAWDALAADLEITNYTTPYRYPPHTAAFLSIFQPLGPKTTMMIWVIGNALAMMGGAWLIGRSLSPAGWLPVSLGALLLFVPPLATLLAGQINGLLFFCLALALWGLSQQRPGWLGVSLAIGTALKVLPLALILYLFWRRQWRAALIAVVALILLTLASVLVVGWEGLVAYGQNAIDLGRPEVVYSTGSNQTITAVLGRIEPHSPIFVLTVARWLGLLIVLLTAGLCWPAGDSTRWMPIEFGLIVAALQLIPPFTWYHQLVLLLLPFLLVMHHLWQQQWPALTLLVILFILTNIHGLAWHYLPSPWLLSFPFLFGLTLWLFLGGFIIFGRKFTKPAGAT